MTVDREVQRIAKLGSWSDAEAKVMVDAWRRSGESRVAFGRRYGIAMHRLYFWVSKFGDKRVRALRRDVHFHPVRVTGRVTGTEASSPEPIEIRVISVPRGVAVDELRAVLTALRG